MRVLSEASRFAGNNSFAKEHHLGKPHKGEGRKHIATTAEALSHLGLGRNLEDFLQRVKDLSEESQTDAAANLARGENVLDVISKGRRFLIYPNRDDDKKAYELLRELGIPQLERVRYEPNPDITIVNVPQGAWRLDSSDYPEQEPMAPEGNGAIEIMEKLGLLLNSINRRTGLFPQNFKLCKIAFVAGNKDFIQLIPPYSFSPNVLPNDLVSRVREDLDQIDPINPHQRQVKAFSTALYNET